MKRFLLSLALIFGVFAAANASVVVGAEQLKEYMPQLKGKRVAVLANHTAMVGSEHLVDMLVR